MGGAEGGEERGWRQREQGKETGDLGDALSSLDCSLWFIYELFCKEAILEL